MPPVFLKGDLTVSKDVKNEFHLEKVQKDTLVLQSFANYSNEYTRKNLQPGEPTDSEWKYTNPNQGQLLHFRLTVKGESGKMINPELEFNNRAIRRMSCPTT